MQLLHKTMVSTLIIRSRSVKKLLRRELVPNIKSRGEKFYLIQISNLKYLPCHLTFLYANPSSIDHRSGSYIFYLFWKVSRTVYPSLPALRLQWGILYGTCCQHWYYGKVSTTVHGFRDLATSETELRELATSETEHRYLATSETKQTSSKNPRQYETLCRHISVTLASHYVSSAARDALESHWRFLSNTRLPRAVLYSVS